MFGFGRITITQVQELHAALCTRVNKLEDQVKLLDAKKDSHVIFRIRACCERINSVSNKLANEGVTISKEEFNACVDIQSNSFSLLIEAMRTGELALAAKTKRALAAETAKTKRASVAETAKEKKKAMDHWKLAEDFTGVDEGRIFTVYHIRVGGLDYAGFTGQKFDNRITQHLEGGVKKDTRVQRELKKQNYEFVVVSTETYTNEVEALIAERSKIASLPADRLNDTPGGEGANYNVSRIMVEGSLIIIVGDKSISDEYYDSTEGQYVKATGHVAIMELLARK